jgi:hypothetical protein
MTANGHARFGDAWESHEQTIEEQELVDSLNSEFASSSFKPPETSSANALKGTYRARFLAGREDEYEATLEAYRELYQRESNPHVQALEGCRTFATFQRDSVTGDLKVFGDSCRDRWCPMCAGQKAAYAKDQTAMFVKSLKAPRFLTLTLRNDGSDLKPQIEFLQSAFARLRSRAYWKKNVTGGIWFLQVKRGKNSGCWHPHLHILLDGSYMEQGRLSALWELVTFGSPVIDIRRVHDADSAASYVARYTARPAALSEMPICDRIEVIEALFRKRLSGTFGTGKSVTLTPPKIESDTQWDYVGHHDDIVERAEFDSRAKAILVAFHTYQPLSEKEFEDFTGHKPGDKSVFEPPPPKEKQMLLDFYNS